MSDNEKEEAANLVHIYLQLWNCYSYRYLSRCFIRGRRLFYIVIHIASIVSERGV